MIQAIGLTSTPRRRRPPAVDDLTFDAGPGRVTALLGPRGAGKTTALRLILQLQAGRGVALFRGRPLHRIRYPAREIGVVLGDVPGHPARTARGYLQMLAAVAGVPVERAEDMLELVGLSGLAEERTGSFSRGMDRRLGIAAALLGDPHTLVLDEPAHGLSPREAGWLHGLLRSYADQGGAVLTTFSDAKEAAKTADRIVTLEDGRLVADQETADFARTRLRPRVAVASPHAERLAAVLARQARQEGTPERRDPASAERTEVVHEGGARIRVYGSSCAAVGETAYRHGILIHRLAEETGDTGDRAVPVPLARADGRPAPGAGPGVVAGAARSSGTRRRAAASAAWRTGGDGAKAPPLPAVPRPGPAAPLRYELRRLLGVRTPWYVLWCALVAALAAGIVLALAGPAPEVDELTLRLLAGWPPPAAFPLPPAAAAAGLLGALAFGQEFRYPGLAPAHAPVPRRLGLLGAKLLVTAAASLLLCLATVVLNGVTLGLLFGPGVLAPPAGAPGPFVQGAWFLALTLGCAWAGLLAAGAARSTLAGLAAVLAVPLLIVPVVRELVPAGEGRSFGDLAGRLETAFLVPWPSGADRWVAVAVRLLSQPVVQAFALAVLVLFSAYLLLGLRSRAR